MCLISIFFFSVRILKKIDNGMEMKIALVCLREHDQHIFVWLTQESACAYRHKNLTFSLCS